MSRFSTSTTTAGNSLSSTTLLAGLSVALSFASLVLSYQTWRRQSAWLREEEIINVSNNAENGDVSITVGNNKRSATPVSASNSAKEKPINSNCNSNEPTSKSSNSAVANDPNRIRATLENQVLSNGHGANELTVRPIGVVRSIYRLCVGTPRQGLLAPHARGRIELSYLTMDIAKDSIAELERFSHIWILFVFHLNTLPSKKQTTSPKIAPPALGGLKVGVLATRSPHRFNPIGITLAKLDRIEIKDKSQQQQHQQGGSRVVLHISGLDLVDGTPVLDVKPFVPTYDSVNPQLLENQQYNNKTNMMDNTTSSHIGVRLPPWVSEGLATRRTVTISESAQQDLKTILETNNTKRSPLDFYGSSYGETTQEALDNMLACISEVLSMDVRSSWQTKKAREGRSKAQRAHRVRAKKNPQSQSQSQSNAKPQQADGMQQTVVDEELSATIPPSTSCTQQLDNLLLHFTVAESPSVQRSTSEGSGAEDQIYVTSIQHLR